MGRRLLYLVWSLIMCKYFIRCSICSYWLLVQGTIHLLSGECSCVFCVVFHKFSLYIPMVLMVYIQYCVHHLPVCMMRVQGWVGIAATCWVSWWLGVRGGTIIRKGSEVPQWIGSKWSNSCIFSLPVLQHFSDTCVVELVGTVCMFPQHIVLGNIVLHCPWCVALVIIPSLSIFHEFLLSHSVWRVLFCFWVVWLGCCLNLSVI